MRGVHNSYRVILRTLSGSEEDEESKQVRFFVPEFTLSEANVGLRMTIGLYTLLR